MNVTILDELTFHEVTVSDEELYFVTLSDSNFITIVEDDIMEVTISDGACC